MQTREGCTFVKVNGIAVPHTQLSDRGWRPDETTARSTGLAPRYPEATQVGSYLLYARSGTVTCRIGVSWGNTSVIDGLTVLEVGKPFQSNVSALHHASPGPGHAHALRHAIWHAVIAARCAACRLITLSQGYGSLVESS